MDKVPLFDAGEAPLRSTSSFGAMNLSGVDLWLPLGFGLFAGLAIIAMVGNWLKFVLGLRQSVSSAYPPKAQPRILGFPLLAFISPAPWIGFIGLPFAAYHFIRVRHSTSAALFFGVIGGLILVWLVGSVFLIWHFRKRFRQKQSQ
ncbi:MAG TPA: hypothetical protein VIY68_08270 [Steroidobacteraceae bacterium]